MIDVIIPCYNAHKTIDRTLQSICLQSIKDKLHVLLVDDCSKDNYDEFINRYNKQLDIDYIRLDENLGPGVAREEGIKHTSNKYITFMDADDMYYSYEALEQLYNKIEEGYDTVNSKEYDQKRSTFVMLTGNVHGKIYSRDFLVKHDIHFNNTRFHEDNYFNNLVILSDAKIGILNICTYLYYYNDKSVTNDNYTDFNNIGLFLSNMYDVLNIVKPKKPKKVRLIKYIADKYRYLYNMYQTFTDEQKKEFKEMLSKYDNDLILYLDKKETSFLNALLSYTLDYVWE